MSYQKLGTALHVLGLLFSSTDEASLYIYSTSVPTILSLHFSCFLGGFWSILVLLLSVIDFWLQLCTPTSGITVSINTLLKKQSVQFTCKQTLNYKMLILLNSFLLRALHCGVNLVNKSSPRIKSCGCVPVNSTHGSVSVAEKASGCAHCVIFAHRLVPDQWGGKRFVLDIVNNFCPLENSVKHWKGLPREVVKLAPLKGLKEQLKG